MDPKEPKFEIVTAQRPVLSDDELRAEAEAIAAADERDGTHAFFEALFEEAMTDEPDYEW